MFRNLFKKNTKSTEIIKEVAIPCSCDGNNEHCDLILQLRKCQDLRNNIQNEIETLNKNSYELISNFTNFIRRFDECGFHFGRYTSFEESVGIIEWLIKEYSSADIFRITEELRTYKSKEDIISEKRRVLKAVEDDIEKIKAKLGIE
ncbi:MAG: hypothetical protein J6R59_10410 [Paludibacteraceae bacterium]|nr:hypothetical protein [Paludibacteraceae bacterium]